ncbi:MAG: DUF3891 family protein [Candidatus Sumerlaeia bacterium]|nr:DUF3891 family protein [Candidatus Sumerlaeia bacterium]
MILRRDNAGFVLTCQPDHAWASGEVARFVREDLFDCARHDELIALSAHHDDGWHDWEQAPRRHADGRPLNFDEVNAADHEAIWRRGVELAHQTVGAFGAAVLTLHAQDLAAGAGAEAFGDALVTRRGVCLREALPGVDPVQRDWQLERAFAFLRLCDLATLMPCAGWPGPHTVTILDERGGRCDVVLRATRAWELAIEGWPFALGEVHVRIPVVRVKDGNWDGALEACRRGDRSMQALVLRPG